VKWLRWDLLAALLAGLGLGILYAWVLAPVQYVDTTPATLRADYKDQYRFLAASAYAATGNLERARVRLELLDEPDSIQALSAQAQRLLAAGQPMESVQILAALASALQNDRTTMPPTPTSALAALLDETATPAPPDPAPASPSPALDSTPAEAEPTEMPAPLLPPTPRPTRTPVPTQGASYVLTQQEPVCNPALPDGLMQIIVLDAARKPVPGVEVALTWAGGEERFFTGLKPDVGNGYADFSMAPDVLYALRLAQGSVPITGLRAPSCSLDSGSSYWGGLRLEFQQP
jgi:hypothetical protein